MNIYFENVIKNISVNSALWFKRSFELNNDHSFAKDFEFEMMKLLVLGFCTELLIPFLRIMSHDKKSHWFCD